MARDCILQAFVKLRHYSLNSQSSRLPLQAKKQDFNITSLVLCINNLSNNYAYLRKVRLYNYVITMHNFVAMSDLKDFVLTY